MNMSKFKVEIERRQRRYYNLYQYRAVIDMPNVQRFRYHRSHDEYLAHQPPWQPRPNKPLPNKDELDRFLDFKRQATTECGFRIEYDKAMIYSNDLQKLESVIDSISASGSVKIFSVEFPLEEDTIEFAKEPKYKFRNYFRSKSISPEQKTELSDFINNQNQNGNEIEFNNSMMLWLRRTTIGHPYVRDSYYVEYNDEVCRTVLALMFGDILHPKVFRLSKRPK
jgi:hypothetical protein